MQADDITYRHGHMDSKNEMTHILELHIHSSAGHGTTSQLGRMLQLQMPSRHGVPVGVDRSRGSVRASAASSSEVGIGPVGKEAGLARAPRGCREAQAAEAGDAHARQLATAHASPAQALAATASAPCPRALRDGSGDRTFAFRG